MSNKLSLSVILPIKSSKTKDFNAFFDKAIASLEKQETDFDELVHHRISVPGYLERSKATLIRPAHWEMYSDSFPTEEKQITELIGTGARGSYKFNTFRPSEITEMNFDVGCHMAHPTGNVIIDDYWPSATVYTPETEDAIMTLHYYHR